MTLSVATHNGPFHADDVLAYALIRCFLDAEATVVRSRDRAVLDQADVVFDVGAVFDPEARRFDHHQKTYEGPLSSAGMVLAWLAGEGAVDERLRSFLDTRIVAYVDDVDNGRVEPREGVPCFATLVDGYNRGNDTLADFDARFLEAARMAQETVEGLRREHAELMAAEAVVVEAMEVAEAKGSNLLELPYYVRWKPPYFERGGETHPTEFAILPGMDGSWRVLGIPPRLGSFDQKRPLPEAWAGLTDEALVDVCGVPGARFCHKNLFIAVFDTREHLLQALAGAGLVRGDRAVSPR